MSDAPGAHGSCNGGAPWSLPDDFLTPPDDVAGPSIAVNLRDVNQNQVMKLAQEYNRNHGVDQDPFEAVLAGIPESAQLRPGSKEPISLYMGLQGLPPHGRYAKAWRKLLRGPMLLSGDKDQEPPAKRAKTAAGAAAAGTGAAAGAGEARARAAARASHPSQWTAVQLKPVLTDEQQRWRSNLAAYLGRPVDVPLLAPGAPVLDLKDLFIQVMQQGGYQQVTDSNGWQQFAQYMQRDASFGPLLAAVYSCYLHPLEQDLPFAFRAARAEAHMLSSVQVRAEMGARVATHDGVVYAADRAHALLMQLQAPQASPAAPAAAAAAAAAAGDGSQQQQQQQQQQQRRAGVNVARCSLQLLQAAARDPGALLDLQQQHGLRGVLHRPSHQAAIQEYRKRGLAALRRQGFPLDCSYCIDLQETPDDILFGVDASEDQEEDRDDEDGAGDSASGEGGSGSDEEEGQEDSQGRGEAQEEDGEGSQQQQQHKKRRGASAAAAGAAARPPPSPAAASGAAGMGQDRPAAAAAAAGGSGVKRGRGRPSSAGRGGGRGQGEVSAVSASAAADDGSPGGGRGRGRGRGRPRKVVEAAGGSAGSDADGGAAAAAAAVGGPHKQQQQQQQHQGDRDSQSWRSDGVVLDAARWLLLSRRAVLSGPVGCQTPLLQLPGMRERQQAKCAPGSSSGGGRGRGRARGGKGRGRGKRTFMGRTPRCGTCHTCINPGLKKACVVNRARLRAGQGVKVARGHSRGRGSAGRGQSSGRGRGRK